VAIDAVLADPGITRRDLDQRVRAELRR